MRRTFNPPFFLSIILFAAALVGCQGTIDEQIEEIRFCDDREEVFEIGRNLADSNVVNTAGLLYHRLDSVPAIDALRGLAKGYRQQIQSRRDKQSIECLRAMLEFHADSSERWTKVQVELILDQFKKPERASLTTTLYVRAAKTHGSPFDELWTTPGVGIWTFKWLYDETVVDQAVNRYLGQVAEESDDVREQEVRNILKLHQDFASGFERISSERCSELSQQLKDTPANANILARVGRNALPALYELMNSDNQKERFAAADALVAMLQFHPNDLDDLTSNLEDSQTIAIAEKYPFYIRLGQQGTENLLLASLKDHFTRNMCLDFLNCGNDSIESVAADIAEQKGYNVYRGPGFHSGPKWGRH